MKQMSMDQVNVSFPINIPDLFKPYRDEMYKSITGRTWTMKDLREHCGNRSVDWIKTKILYNPKFSRVIGAMEREGQIHESTGPGNPWMFKATAMADFLEEHYEEING